MFGALAEEDKIVTKTLGNFIAMGPVTFVTNAEIPGLKFTKQIDMLPFLKYLNIFHLPMPSVVNILSSHTSKKFIFSKECKFCIRMVVP